MAPHHGYAAFAAAVLGFSLVAAPAHACRGANCTAAQAVVVERGFREVIEGPPVVVVAPERVMVAPGRVDEMTTAPETVTVFDEIDMQPAGYRWEHRRCPPGQRRCKVFVPAESKFVEREIVVRPGRRVSVVTPPEYALERRVVAVRPGFAIERGTFGRERPRRHLRMRDIIPPGGWIGW